MQGRDHSAIGKRAQSRRKQLGLTVDEVAQRVGYSVGRVYNFECYGAGTIAAVELWARALEMDPRVLAFGPYTDDEARADREAHQRSVDRWLVQLAP
jgi:transcriptional regulator with XRE-family HTH domain